MATDVLALADRLWRGEVATSEIPAIAQARQHVFSLRANKATSTMAAGVFRWAAAESLGEG